MNTFLHMVQVFVYRVVGIQRGGKMAVIRFAEVFTLYPNKGISLCLNHPELVQKHPTHLARSVMVWFKHSEPTRTTPSQI